MDSITPREEKLLDFIRKLKYGTITVEIQNQEPVIIREAVKTIKL